MLAKTGIQNYFAKVLDLDFRFHGNNGNDRIAVDCGRLNERRAGIVVIWID
jgi:hypothetical protein